MFRSNLSLDETLTSIMAVKLSIGDEKSFEPNAETLNSAKKATYNYNLEHSTKK